jgi:hypothetical protein
MLSVMETFWKDQQSTSRTLPSQSASLKPETATRNRRSGNGLSGRSIASQRLTRGEQ